MGLVSKGSYGVKSQLKERFPSAFRRCDTLADARDACNATRQQSVIVIDGNVIFMAIPSAVTTLDGFVFLINRTVTTAMATADVVVVVFDEPEVLTTAKAQEQMRRDSKRRETQVFHSDDIEGAVPENDDYTIAEIQKSPDVNLFMRNRATRLRFVDEICRIVFERMSKLVNDWNKAGYKGGHLVLDGIDIRGASRPIGEKRVASIVSTSELSKQVFARNVSIGEGDLKLAHVGRTVRLNSTLEDGLFAKTTVSLVSTIDTDSFAIELIEEARRSGDRYKSSVGSVLCFRERASKRGREDDHEAFYLCCDLKMLYEEVQAHMWGLPSASLSAVDARSAVTLLVAGWSMCGCDFVDTVKPLRSDVVFNVLPSLLRRHGPSLLESMPVAWEGKRDNLCALHVPLRLLLQACSTWLSNAPRSRKAVVAEVANVDELVLKRVSWLLAYWNSVEVRGNLQEFGFYVPHSFD